MGFAQDVEIALEVNKSCCCPKLIDGAYLDATLNAQR